MLILLSFHQPARQDGRVTVRAPRSNNPHKRSGWEMLTRYEYRQELVQWLNSLLQLNITKVEQCGTGYVSATPPPPTTACTRHPDEASQTDHIAVPRYARSSTAFIWTCPCPESSSTSTPNTRTFKILRCCKVRPHQCESPRVSHD